jgi:hypothetical protein
MPEQRLRLMGAMLVGLLTVSRVSAYADPEQPLGAPLDGTFPVTPEVLVDVDHEYVVHDERCMIDERCDDDERVVDICTHRRWRR